MYKVGDKVSYPMHGAGVIESIEERVILGEKQEYYTMKMPIGNMKVMIPVKHKEGAGLRDVIDEKKADEVIEFLGEHEEEEQNNWNKRYRENVQRIKTGDIFEVAAVVKMLMIRDKAKGLPTGERKMLSDARHILISELVIAKSSTDEEICALVEKRIFKD